MLSRRTPKSSQGQDELESFGRCCKADMDLRRAALWPSAQQPSWKGRSPFLRRMTHLPRGRRGVFPCPPSLPPTACPRVPRALPPHAVLLAALLIGHPFPSGFSLWPPKGATPALRTPSHITHLRREHTHTDAHRHTPLCLRGARHLRPPAPPRLSLPLLCTHPVIHLCPWE